MESGVMLMLQARVQIEMVLITRKVSSFLDAFRSMCKLCAIWRWNVSYVKFIRNKPFMKRW